MKLRVVLTITDREIMMKKTNIKGFSIGDKVLILGETDQDRDVVEYSDPVSFVKYMSDKHKIVFETNEEFMDSMARLLNKVSITIPHHNEEAFINGLIRIGICKHATLN